MDQATPNSGPIDQAYTPASAPTEAVRDQAPPQTAPSVADQPGYTPQSQDVEQQPSEPQVDYQARARELEQRAQAAEAERQRLQQQMQSFQQNLAQIQQQTEKQKEREAFQQRQQQILAQARAMRVDEGEQFIARQMESLYEEFDQRSERIRQEEQQRLQQTVRQVAAPTFIRDVVMKQYDLPAEAFDRLMAFGDPDLAAKQAPYLKEEYDNRRKLEEQLRQLSRSQQAQQVQQSGVTRLGGYAAASGGVDVPEGLSADERAMYIYSQLTRR